MTILYLNPLSRGWNRMKKALFQPFDLKKWFIVGFTAFLAELTDCHGGNGGGQKYGRGTDLHDILYFPHRAWEWLGDHPGWLLVILFGIAFIAVLAIAVTWVSSRGKFMFLDNVVHNRSLVAAPWREFRNEGNSYFVWSFLYGLFAFALLIFFVVTCYFSILNIYEQTGNPSLLIGPAIWMALGLIALILLTGFGELLLEDFVVPIMFKYRISTGKALGMFFPLLGAHFFQFVGYCLLVAVIVIGIVIGVILAGLLTCCIGFVVLIVPYINSVVLLPISYTMRAFSVEFLEQFGPDFHIFPQPTDQLPGDIPAQV